MEKRLWLFKSLGSFWKLKLDKNCVNKSILTLSERNTYDIWNSVKLKQIKISLLMSSAWKPRLCKVFSLLLLSLCFYVIFFRLFSRIHWYFYHFLLLRFLSIINVYHFNVTSFNLLLMFYFLSWITVIIWSPLVSGVLVVSC